MKPNHDRTPGLLMGLLPLVTVGAMVVAAALRRLTGVSPVRGVAEDGSFASLRAAILRNTKQNVVRVLGPPHAAIVARGGEGGVPASTYWQADTWYYPLNRRQRAAMAIRFGGDRAEEVEMIRVPWR
jgi:hypothetical protein